MGVQNLKICYFGGPPAESPTFECRLNWLVESPLLLPLYFDTSEYVFKYYSCICLHMIYNYITLYFRVDTSE